MVIPKLILKKEIPIGFDRFNIYNTYNNNNLEDKMNLRVGYIGEQEKLEGRE